MNSLAGLAAILVAFLPRLVLSDVHVFSLVQEEIEATFESGLEMVRTESQTRIFDGVSFEWTLPSPFRVASAVEMKAKSKVAFLVVRTEGSAISYAFILTCEQQSGGWRAVGPIGDQSLMMADEEWIDMISVPIGEPDQLIVQFVKKTEWSGGKRLAVREWRYWDFDAGKIGPVFVGEVMPCTPHVSAD